MTAAPVQACFALIAPVRDINLLHRGGSEARATLPTPPRRSCRQAASARRIGAPESPWCTPVLSRGVSAQAVARICWR